jgi:hypothetical protein
MALAKGTSDWASAASTGPSKEIGLRGEILEGRKGGEPEAASQKFAEVSNPQRKPPERQEIELTN